VYTIARARRSDLPQLPAIELAAAKLLTGYAPDAVLAETTSLDEFKHARSRGHLWVALSKAVPVGFAQVEVLEPLAAHLKEIDVHPDHGQQGIGTRLVMTVCHWAAMTGHAFVTLTTFRHVPWNMPFYAKLGFAEIGSEDLSSALRSVLEAETRRGLDPERRVAMRRPCGVPWQF
jgi:GNAT superfamily N-acetyltransferase